MGVIEDRLAGMGLQLPAPLAAPRGMRLPYESVRIHGDLAYVAGHGPFDGDRQLFSGRVGAELSVEQAYDAARARWAPDHGRARRRSRHPPGRSRPEVRCAPAYGSPHGWTGTARTRPAGRAFHPECMAARDTCDPATFRPPARRRRRVGALVAAWRGRPPAWAGYAASALAIAYAVGVRGYQGLGGTVGVAGRFEDPAAMRQASLIAGAGLLLVGLGALALVRPWGLRLPRRLVIIPALAGSAYAAAHALTAYVTKPLDSLGVVHLHFDGWARRDPTAQFLWDLLFYEPWFLGLGILVTLGTLHHHRRTGGSERQARQLLIVTVVATLALTAVACGLVVVRSD